MMSTVSFSPLVSIAVYESFLTSGAPYIVHEDPLITFRFMGQVVNPSSSSVTQLATGDSSVIVPPEVITDSAPTGCVVHL